MFPVNYFYRTDSENICLNWPVTLSVRVSDGWYYGHTGAAGHRHGLVSAHHVEIISSHSQKVLQVVDAKKLMDEQKKTKEA